jgi:hypothetical protein
MLLKDGIEFALQATLLLGHDIVRGPVYYG